MSPPNPLPVPTPKPISAIPYEARRDAVAAAAACYIPYKPKPVEPYDWEKYVPAWVPFSDGFRHHPGKKNPLFKDEDCALDQLHHKLAQYMPLAADEEARLMQGARDLGARHARMGWTRDWQH